MKPRFQFTIREVLWATFWAAVSIAAWTWFYRFPIAWENTGALQACLFLAVGSAVIAVGTLVNRTKLAFVIVLVTVGSVITIWVVRSFIYN